MADDSDMSSESLVSSTNSTPSNYPSPFPRNRARRNNNTSSTPSNFQASLNSLPRTKSSTAVSKPLRWPSARTSGTVYLRIGRRRAEDDSSGDIPMQGIFVAELDFSQRKIFFRTVDTWLVNGVRIGDCEEGDRVQDTDWSWAFEGDLMWRQGKATSRKKLVEGLLLIFRAYPNGPPVQREVGGVEVDREENDGDGLFDDGKVILPVELPLKPVMTMRDFSDGVDGFRAWDLSSPVTNRKGRRVPEQIDAVVVFVNEMDDEYNLGLPVNLQPGLDLTEHHADFKRYLLHGDDAFVGGLATRLYMWDDWDIEIWVLPQVRGGKELFCWDRVAEMPASGFLDEDMVQEFGAQLYFEVRILPKEEVEIKSEEEGCQAL